MWLHYIRVKLSTAALWAEGQQEVDQAKIPHMSSDIAE